MSESRTDIKADDLAYAKDIRDSAMVLAATLNSMVQRDPGLMDRPDAEFGQIVMAAIGFLAGSAAVATCDYDNAMRLLNESAAVIADFVAQHIRSTRH